MKTETKKTDTKKAATKTKTMTGASILWECLEREGVRVVFGYPGGAILPAYVALKHSNIHH
ncbi:MAG: thiamine pyrophosphate-binding protein, partial [Terriglobales bacterium]